MEFSNLKGLFFISISDNVFSTEKQIAFITLYFLTSLKKVYNLKMCLKAEISEEILKWHSNSLSLSADLRIIFL